ncbi:hypothetical protein CBL_01701 [Carabus blaptoides fortunei]
MPSHQNAMKNVDFAIFIFNVCCRHRHWSVASTDPNLYGGCGSKINEMELPGLAQLVISQLLELLPLFYDVREEWKDRAMDPRGLLKEIEDDTGASTAGRSAAINLTLVAVSAHTEALSHCNISVSSPLQFSLGSDEYPTH